jgi:hypothetical protein
MREIANEVPEIDALLGIGTRDPAARRLHLAVPVLHTPPPRPGEPPAGLDRFRLPHAPLTPLRRFFRRGEANDLAVEPPPLELGERPLRPPHLCDGRPTGRLDYREVTDVKLDLGRQVVFRE